MEKRKVACYCRVSTKKESQQSSIENQQQFFHHFLQKNPQYELYQLYIDEGISAKSIQKRKGFLKMIEDAKSGCFHKILVKDISRFARNVVDLLETIRELRRYNVTVEFVTYNMETIGNSEFVLTVLAAIAQEESHNTSIKVKFGKKIAAQKGTVPSVVYGYDHVKENTMEINQGEADVVAFIFDLYVHALFGPQKIAGILNDKKIPTKFHSEKGWTAATVRRILKNQIYIGKVCNGKTETIDYLSGIQETKQEKDWIITEKPELQIISHVLFQKAQEIRQERSVSVTKKLCPSVKYPLSNLIFCGVDRGAFRRKTKQGSSSIYWVCGKRDKYGRKYCCNKVFVEEMQIHTVLMQFLMEFQKEKQVLQDIFYKKNEEKKQENDFKNKEKLNFISEQAKLKNQRQKLMKLYLSDVIDQQFLEEEVSNLETRMEQIKIKLKNGQQKEEKDTIYFFRLFLDQVSEESGLLLQNAFLKQIFIGFFVYPDGLITVHLKGMETEIPFAEVVKGIL